MRTAWLFVAVVVAAAIIQLSEAGSKCLTRYRCRKTRTYYVSCGFMGWHRCRRHGTYYTTCHRKCPIDARMSTWSSWQHIKKCSKSCGEGHLTMRRTRRCTPPRYGGKKCGAIYEVKAVKCNQQPCPVHGKWTDWEDWTPVDECPVLCGGATTKLKRKRGCTDPAPLHGGKDCTGDSVQIQTAGECNTKPCGDLCPKDENKFHAHSFDNRLYYQCDDTQVARLRSCPDFGTWQQDFLKCVPQPCDVRYGILDEHPSDCKKFMFCLMGKIAIEFSCPAGTSFDISTRRCQKSNHGECSTSY